MSAYGPEPTSDCVLGVNATPEAGLALFAEAIAAAAIAG